MRAETADSVLPTSGISPACSTAATRSAAAAASLRASSSEASLTARDGRGDRRGLDPRGVGQSALEGEDRRGPGPVGDGQPERGAAPAGPGRSEVTSVEGSSTSRPREEREELVGGSDPGRLQGRHDQDGIPGRRAARAWSAARGASPGSRSAREGRHRGRAAAHPHPTRACARGPGRCGHGGRPGPRPTARSRSGHDAVAASDNTVAGSDPCATTSELSAAVASTASRA